MRVATTVFMKLIFVRWVLGVMLGSSIIGAAVADQAAQGTTPASAQSLAPTLTQSLMVAVSTHPLANAGTSAAGAGSVIAGSAMQSLKRGGGAADDYRAAKSSLPSDVDAASNYAGAHDDRRLAALDPSQIIYEGTQTQPPGTQAALLDLSNTRLFARQDAREPPARHGRTPEDFMLMGFVALMLIAYQLRRKHRFLRPHPFNY